jgi:hypothetical protein
MMLCEYGSDAITGVRPLRVDSHPSLLHSETTAMQRFPYAEEVPRVSLQPGEHLFKVEVCIGPASKCLIVPYWQIAKRPSTAKKIVLTAVMTKTKEPVTFRGISQAPDHRASDNPPMTQWQETRIRLLNERLLNEASQKARPTCRMKLALDDRGNPLGSAKLVDGKWIVVIGDSKQTFPAACVRAVETALRDTGGSLVEKNR